MANALNDTRSISYGSPYDRRNLADVYQGMKDAYINGIQAAPEWLVGQMAPEQYTPGVIASTPKDQIRAAQMHREQNIAQRRQDIGRDYEQGMDYGTALGMIADPYLDLPLAGIAKLAKVGQATRAQAKPFNALSDLAHGEKGLIEAQFKPQLPQQAKEFFGTTRTPAESGYILPEGEMLDMSGRHYGDPGPNPGRGVDHRELGGWSRYTGDDAVYLTEKGGTEGMFEFMNTSGSVRWMPEANGVSATSPPTRKQVQQIIRNFNEIKRNTGQETLLLGADHPSSMNQIDSIDMDRPNIDKIMKWYDDAFDGMGSTSTDYDIANVDWKKVSKFLKKEGYDIRGGDDAKMIFEKYQSDDPPEQWVRALSYASK